MIQVKIKLVHPHAKLPTRAYAGDSGWDCYSCEEVTLIPGETRSVRLGFAAEVPAGYEIQARPRSSTLANGGLHLAFGTVDSSFRGELCAVLHNLSQTARVVAIGDRIAQIVIAPVPEVELILADELAPSERSTRGWGSSGR